ncbi:MAG: cupin domain-containing protein, partial [Mesorhizobium sp.]
HGSAEFIYVLSGRLVVNVNGKDAALETGDAVYFDSSVPHGYRREGEAIATAIVVTSS